LGSLNGPFYSMLSLLICFFFYLFLFLVYVHMKHRLGMARLYAEGYSLVSA